MIFLKKLLKSFLSFLICTAVFVGVSYLFLGINTGKDIGANTEKSGVPYNKAIPDNCMIKVFCGNENENFIKITLDFSDNKILLCLTDKNGTDKNCKEKRNVYVNEDFLPLFIDRIGGINTEIDGENVRLTGNTALKYLKTDNEVLKYQIILSVFETLNQNGLNKDDMIFLTERCIQTDISLKDILIWKDYLPEMFKSVSVS